MTSKVNIIILHISCTNSNHIMMTSRANTYMYVHVLSNSETEQSHCREINKAIAERV